MFVEYQLDPPSLFAEIEQQTESVKLAALQAGLEENGVFAIFSFQQVGPVPPEQLHFFKPKLFVDGVVHPRRVVEFDLLLVKLM